MPQSHLDTRTEPTAPGPATIVVVDDDQALLNALRFDLELEGFNVQTHPAAALLSLDRLPKDNGCLVIDYRLPDVNGLELLQRLRDGGVGLPAILITSHPSKAVQAGAAFLGGSIIEKPLLGDTLLAGIRAALASAT